MQIERRFTLLHGASVVLLLVLLAAVGSTLASHSGKVAPLGDDDERGLRRDAFHGIKEFTQSGTFTVPDDVTTILVEIYAAGGGGGGWEEAVGAPFGVGGGGGAGAFSRSVIHVTPRCTLAVSVGIGGADGKYSNGGGAPPATNGGDSDVSLNGIPLITARGGKAGLSNLYGGTGGAGGAVDPTAMISHAGENGGPGLTANGSDGGGGGTGYLPLGLPVDSGGVSGGGSGTGNGDCSTVGCSGFPGYVLLTY